jgi:ketosteroid isomerase-like protein
MSILENAQNLQKMMAEGQAWEAFEKYYHDDVHVIEMPTGEERKGKSAQRKAIEEWYNMLDEFHDGGVNSVCSDEENGISTAESWMDVTFKDGNRMKMSEVAVQKWKDGQIIEEKFYYHDGTVNS